MPEHRAARVDAINNTESGMKSTSSRVIAKDPDLASDQDPNSLRDNHHRPQALDALFSIQKSTETRNLMNIKNTLIIFIALLCTGFASAQSQDPRAEIEASYQLSLAYKAQAEKQMQLALDAKDRDSIRIMELDFELHDAFVEYLQGLANEPELLAEVENYNQYVFTEWVYRYRTEKLDFRDLEEIEQDFDSFLEAELAKLEEVVKSQSSLDVLKESLLGNAEANQRFSQTLDGNQALAGRP